jgi:inner membrane protein
MPPTIIPTTSPWDVLTNEDDALLVGSIGLFVLLAAVMFVTRRVDWFRIDSPRNEMKPAA